MGRYRVQNLVATIKVTKSFHEEIKECANIRRMGISNYVREALELWVQLPVNERPTYPFELGSYTVSLSLRLDDDFRRMIEDEVYVRRGGSQSLVVRRMLAWYNHRTRMGVGL